MKPSFFAWLTLLVGAYLTLLWWTADAHQPAAALPKLTMIEPAPSKTNASAPMFATAAKAPAMDEMHERSILSVEEDITTERDVEEATVLIEAPPVTPAAPSKPISAWVGELRSARATAQRLAAIQALLLLGRQSTVDTQIVDALREAASDTDAQVANAANSALAEVERPTH